MSASSDKPCVKSQSTTPAPLGWLNGSLENLSRYATALAGSSWGFGAAVFIVILWAASGPFFRFSELWQLVINTGTTIITFLMVFLIQRSQNKESLAVQVKLNELLASQQGASNKLINAEDLSEESIKALHQRFQKLATVLKTEAEDCAAHSVIEADDDEATAK